VIGPSNIYRTHFNADATQLELILAAAGRFFILAVLAAIKKTYHVFFLNKNATFKLKK
jgi:hypothetical protein